MLQQQPGTFVWQQWIQVQNVKGEGEVQFKTCQQQVLHPRQARPQKSAKLWLIKKWKMLKQPKNWRCLNTGWQDRSQLFSCVLRNVMSVEINISLTCAKCIFLNFVNLIAKLGVKKNNKKKHSKHLYSLMLASKSKKKKSQFMSSKL